jgi:hypothetical protein
MRRLMVGEEHEGKDKGMDDLLQRNPDRRSNYVCTH